MKKILAMMLILSAGNAFGMNEDSMRTKVVCEAGYKFLLVWSSQGVTPTVVQIFKPSDKIGGSPQPMRCDQ